MKNWNTTVPLGLTQLNRKNMPLYAARLKAMGADRVFLAAPDGMTDHPPFPKDWLDLKKRLIKAKAFFNARGIAVAYWLGRTIGHNQLPTDRKDWPFQPIVGPTGKEAEGCFCPLDKRFRGYLSSGLATMARSGVELIVLDDDFRMNGHGPDTDFACYCPLHLAEFRARTGRKISREKLFKEAMGGAPSRTRDQWLDIQGKTLMLLAGDLEQAVHRVNPRARLGLCSVIWHNSGHDGVELPALVKKLAGNTRPFMRTIGAPYWDKQPFHVCWVTEYTRLQASWSKGHDIELLAEGDTWPHTRFSCSAAMLGAYQEWLMASGFPGILCYALGYTGNPDFETGFWRKISASRRHSQAILGFFPSDYQALGVRPLEPQNSFRHWVMPSGPGTNNWANQPAALRLLSRMGIPLTYEKTGGPVLITGWSASGLSRAEIQEALRSGAVLDAIAAQWLLQKGFDIGVLAVEEAPVPRTERFIDPGFSGRHLGLNLWPGPAGKNSFYRCQPAPRARVLSEFLDSDQKRLYPGTLLYENRAGNRFCVLPLGLHSLTLDLATPLPVLNYARQEQLTRSLTWVNRRPLAVSVQDIADVHVLCRVSPSRDRLAIAVQNAHSDPIQNPVLRLDPAIEVGKTIELLVPAAGKAQKTSAFKYRNDGEYGHLTVPCTIPSMGMMSVGITRR